MELCLNRKLLPLVQQELPIGNCFCCMDCSRIHSALQNLLVSGEEKFPESLLDVVKKKIEERGIECTTDLDIRWRLLSGKMVSKETRPLLSKAVSIFHERFDPIEVSSTASIDLIPKMVYGSTIVSAGIIRIFGEEVAELPSVATSIDFQGQGYFQVLFSRIENLLGYLKVRTLVLPAADGAESLWTNRFGFTGKIPETILSDDSI